MRVALGDLVQEVDERRPPPGTMVLSVSEGRGIVPQSELFRKQIATSDRSRYRIVRFGDVVYNPFLLWNRAVGVCFDERGGCVSPAYVVLRPKEPGIERFLHYLTRSDAFAVAVDAIASGSVTRRRTAPVADVLRLEFDLPMAPDRRAASATLDAIDRRLELNLRLSRTEDAIARAIYKSWFVDFEPVRARLDEVTPESAGELTSRMPDLTAGPGNGQPPPGWRWGVVGDVAVLNPESWSERNVPSVIRYVDLSNAKWGHVEAVPTIRKQDAPSRARRVLRKGDTIVGTVRPGNGSYAFIQLDDLTASTGFAVLRPVEETWAEFVYLATTASANIRELGRIADGGAYPAVRPAVVAQTRTVIPPNHVRDDFSKTVAPLLAAIASRNRESQTLHALRDLLVPKFISGESVFNRAFEAVSPP
jgi:type I restriction enzyme S subunit